MSHERGSRSAVRSTLRDEPGMGELVDYFVGTMPEKIAGLLTTLERGSVDDLRRLAHQIKGASGGYGFDVLGDAAGRVEAAAARGEPVESIRAQVDELVDLCRRVTV